MGSLTVLKPGLLTTVQDLGRFGFRKYGVPLSGAMDQASAQLANLLANNAPSVPVIEITLIGPEILFNDDACIAITGADLSAKVNGASVHLNKCQNVKKGDILSFGTPQMGARAYLAIAGLQSQKVLGSYSQFEGITEHGRLAAGEKITFDSSVSQVCSYTRVKQPSFESNDLTVYPSLEFGLFDKETLERLLNVPIMIKENNRMGYRLIPSEPITHNQSMITSQVVPGTVQLTPDGHLIILMRDGQVTGGYPRIFQLSATAMDLLAQKRSEEKVRFHLSLDT
jgi:biotin-dependent carboxylase-like uncharacterized protein